MYNEHGVMPADLLAHNDDVLFPEFRGHDLSTILSSGVSVDHRARDGATISDLPAQLHAMSVQAEDVVLMSIGGNDLLAGLLDASEGAFARFAESVSAVLRQLRTGKVFVANVYDPSFGDDARNFLGVEPANARRAHQRMNEILAATASRAGASLVDLHAHFLTGDPTWFTRDIEPSLVGASEVRRVFLEAWEPPAPE
jgi:lysophospholipase L1-like esterase